MEIGKDILHSWLSTSLPRGLRKIFTPWMLAERKYLSLNAKIYRDS